MTKQLLLLACLWLGLSSSLYAQFLPYCDTIGIRDVFASEEYPQWGNSPFNDVFAFWISGPGFGPAPGQHIALVPGTPIPVSIDNGYHRRSQRIYHPVCTFRL